MGTGGALRQALPLLDFQFLVLYGDSYLPIDFASVERAFLSGGKPALMTVQRNADQCDKSNVLFVDNAIVEYNKRAPKPSMSHIDYGLGAMSTQVLADENTTGPFDLADLYHRLSLSGELAGYEVSRAVLRDRLARGVGRSGGLFQGWGTIMGYAEQHMRESAEIIGRWIGTDRKDRGSACEGKRPTTGEYFPRRRRQRGQTVPMP